jgi:hypothetical protein
LKYLSTVLDNAPLAHPGTSKKMTCAPSLRTAQPHLVSEDRPDERPAKRFDKAIEQERLTITYRTYLSQPPNMSPIAHLAFIHLLPQEVLLPTDQAQVLVVGYSISTPDAVATLDPTKETQ